VYHKEILELASTYYASFITYYNLNLFNNNNIQIEIFLQLLILFIEWLKLNLILKTLNKL